MTETASSSRHGPPVRRALIAILLFQLGIAVLLVMGDVGRDFALPSRGPAAPGFDRPTQPGDQTRRFDPSDLPAIRPAAPGSPDTAPSVPMPDRLTFELEGSDITLTGRIAEGDADRIAKQVRDHLAAAPSSAGRPRIILNSPGGSVGDALTLGRAIRDTGLATALRPTDICLSACPYIFAGGTERIAEDGARIGVHQHYFGENTLLPAFTAVSDIQRGQGAVMHYLSDMGVDPMLMSHGLVTPPDEIYLLTPEEMSRYDLTTGDAPS
ncbi:hypothetical protein ATO6_12490 [Oceanicola sp. 22II-s10i]|uniref:COG3904 family protein n=1 Tax=Oceanicola sp. 22II-s10i TaxID=1317116 RepID=UPI000B51FABB|nr:hypothetical protein [Oceanicola sp. 22II-s10i]OWU84498.1 hypothetical protein ATO6_12490 [Oceanicola sp. 22II-s10i]